MSVATRFLLLCAMVLALPTISAAQSTPTAISDLPETIGGHSVLAVLTDAAPAEAMASPRGGKVVWVNRLPVAHQPCMIPGEKRLVLQSPQPTIEDALHDFSKEGMEQDLQALNLREYAQQGWTVVGPGVTQQQFVKQAKQSYRLFKAHGCTALKSPIAASATPAAASCSGNECKQNPPYRGFAIIQNTDADIGKANNNAQSVYLIAPKVGNNQISCPPSVTGTHCFTTFLNNVVTNDNCFIWPDLPDWPHWEPCLLQVGLKFEGGQGQVVWTDDAHALAAQPFPIAYHENHTYWTTISYSTGGPWWMCAVDIQDSAKYTCNSAPNTSGTHLQNDQRTSIFVENMNYNSDWNKGFSDEWGAYGAQIYLDGIGHNWSSQDIWTLHACATPWPPGNVIVDSLAHGGSAYLKTSGIPTYCGQSPRF